jgi:hypothetical protein
MADDQTLLSLAEAARRIFPDGRVRASGLRRERDKGHLRTYMVANKEYTTLADLKVMLQECIVPAKAIFPALVPGQKNADEMKRECEVATAACLVSVEALKKLPNRR